MIRSNNTSRRAVIGSIVTGLGVTVSGCLDGTSLGSNSPIEGIYVDATDLIVEIDDSASIDGVNVIDPNGEVFAERSVATGTRRESIEIGTDYLPGEHTVIALEDSSEVDSESIILEPDVQITDLRLGRNHPEEMFDGASDREIDTEAIISVENSGSAPDRIERLTFEGDVPRPTPNNFNESGIANTRNSGGLYANYISIPAEEDMTIYSRQTPFSAVEPAVNCSADSYNGEFAVTVETRIQDEPVLRNFSVSYTGEDLTDCDIDVEVI